MKCTQTDLMLMVSSNNPVLILLVYRPYGEMLARTLFLLGLLPQVHLYIAKVTIAMLLLIATREMMLPTKHSLLLTTVSLLLSSMATLNGRIKP